MAVIFLLVLGEVLDEKLEGLTRRGRACLASAKVLREAVLQDLVDVVSIAEGLLLLTMLPDDTHVLAHAVWVVHVKKPDAGKRPNLTQ